MNTVPVPNPKPLLLEIPNVASLKNAGGGEVSV